MFDLGFTELLVIGVVALLVIGPERLPKVARTAGQWLGRLNRFVADVKQDIDRDLRLEELRKLQAEMQQTAQKYEILAEQVGQRARDEVQQMDRVMQAMAATDGGLAMREYEKIKADSAMAAADTQAAAPVAVSSSDAFSQESSPAMPVSQPAQTPDASAAPADAEPAPRIDAAALTDSPPASPESTPAAKT